MGTTQKPELLTYDQVAARLKVSERMVKRLLWAGDLPKTKVGRHVRVHESDLDAYIERQREGVAS